MKIVTWVDKHGWEHQSLLRETDPDSAAPQGLPYDPPDVNTLDWDGIKRDLHHELLHRGLRTQDDLNNDLSTVALILVPHLRLLYRQTRKED